jgi:hypothetical protein
MFLPPRQKRRLRRTGYAPAFDQSPTAVCGDIMFTADPIFRYAHAINRCTATFCFLSSKPQSDCA